VSRSKIKQFIPAVSYAERGREEMCSDFQRTVFESVVLVRDLILSWYKSPSVQLVLHQFKQVILHRSLCRRNITWDMAKTTALTSAWQPASFIAPEVLGSSLVAREMGTTEQSGSRVG